MFRVLLAESDAEVAKRVCHAFSSDDTCRIVAVESERLQVQSTVAKLKPDLLLINKKMGSARAGRVLPYRSDDLDGLVALAAQRCEQPTGLTRPRIVVIGATRGALRPLLLAWPNEFPVPIVVAGCDQAQLACPGGLRLKQATHGERAQPHTMYFAPDGMHVTVSSEEELLLNEAVPGDHAIDHLFRSVAESYCSASIGVLLNGVGDDGAAGLRAMSARGACTVAETAHETAAAAVTLPVAEIAHYVLECAGKRGRT